MSPFCVCVCFFWCVVWVWFWFGLGVMVFDVGVVWMGGSVLGPVWVRVCLAVCAFVRFPCVFWWGVLRVIDKKTRATTHTRRERCERPSARIMLHAAWACARCTPIYSRRRTTNAHSAFRIRSSSSSVELRGRAAVSFLLSSFARLLPKISTNHNWVKRPLWRSPATPCLG